jgi:hypothetical protein
MTFPKNIDWEATEEKHEAAFWNWCLGEGYHNEDYILDNYGDLFESFAEMLNEEDFVYEAQMAPRD